MEAEILSPVARKRGDLLTKRLFDTPVHTAVRSATKASAGHAFSEFAHDRP